VRAIWLADAVRRLKLIDPFRFMATTTAIFVGIDSMLLGSDASTAMTRVMGGDENSVRLWGAMLCFAGVTATFGPLVGRLDWERLGLWPLGFSLGIVYGPIVIYGLGKGGAIAGPLSIGMGIAAFWRIRRSFREQAEAIARRQHAAESGG
jgi:hypothetical protein